MRTITRARSYMIHLSRVRSILYGERRLGLLESVHFEGTSPSVVSSGEETLTFIFASHDLTD
jgi:hypothetical protein